MFTVYIHVEQPCFMPKVEKKLSKVVGVVAWNKNLAVKR